MQPLAYCSVSPFAYTYTPQCSGKTEKLLQTFGDVLTLRGMPYAEDLRAGIDAALERVSGVSIKETQGDKKRGGLYKT